RLEPHLGLDIRGAMLTAEGDPAADRLGQTALAQPALFVMELAMARLLTGYGIRPGAFLGHSVGELVAAHLAGVLSLHDALAIVAARGRLMQEMPRGAMLAVSLPEGDLAPYLPPSVTVAALNGDTSTTVAGPEEDIASLGRFLDTRGIS